MSKVKEYAGMTKDKLMLYTFVALLVIAIITIISWWDLVAVDTMTGEPTGWPLGLALLGSVLVAVGLAVGADTLISKAAVDSQLNTLSAAVFGLIVALSYSLGLPTMRTLAITPLIAPDALVFVALITVVGIVIFKKLSSMKGRKFVNPAAAAKLIVMLPFLGTLLLPQDHLWDPNWVSGGEMGMGTGLGIPSLAGPIGYEVIGGNGLDSFSNYLAGCYSSPSAVIPTVTTENDMFQLLFMQKFHGWPGGASGLVVIIVGLALFLIARKYIKWRITGTYLGTVALMAVLLHFAYPGGDLVLRLMFELFMGSSIFLAFFMATDPATTPVTHMGQLVFGAGLGLLTVLIQTYMGFLGGSILALVAMNLTSPMLDKLGKMKPTAEKKERKLPKGKQFASVKTTECMRCGACMRVCCHNLSPILIKEAFDKTAIEKLSKLQADLCDGCGHCTFVCPARIDLRASVLRSKALLRQE
jgi:Na+-transporting NADH:ubiquinone oxidoreductase subunit NqrB